MSIGKNVGVAAFVVLSSAFVPACGASADPQFVQSEQVSKSTFKGTWPVTPDSGVLACDSSKANSVTFTPTDSNTTYPSTEVRWAAGHQKKAGQIRRQSGTGRIGATSSTPA